MAEQVKQPVLAPPAVVALKEEASGAASSRGQMERTVSMDMRDEREDLKEAAEHSLNVIMDLDLDGKIRWVSPSWKDVIGTSPDEVHGKAIADLVVDDTNQFAETVESMRKDDSRSQIIRFSVHTGPSSVLRRKRSKPTEDQDTALSPTKSIEDDGDQILNLEGQGIMVYDRTTGGESHVSTDSCLPLAIVNC